MANPFVHVELNTTDLDQARHFYQQLFDWQLQEMPMPQGSYFLIQVGEGTGGGMMTHPIPGAPSAWLPYVLVDDIELATQKARVVITSYSIHYTKLYDGRSDLGGPGWSIGGTFEKTGSWGGLPLCGSSKLQMVWTHLFTQWLPEPGCRTSP